MLTFVKKSLQMCEAESEGYRGVTFLHNDRTNERFVKWIGKAINPDIKADTESTLQDILKG